MTSYYSNNLNDMLMTAATSSNNYGQRDPMRRQLSRPHSHAVPHPTTPHKQRGHKEQERERERQATKTNCRGPVRDHLACVKFRSLRWRMLQLHTRQKASRAPAVPKLGCDPNIFSGESRIPDGLPSLRSKVLDNSFLAVCPLRDSYISSSSVVSCSVHAAV